MSDTALIVIDAQESFRHHDGWQEEGVPGFLARQQQLIDGAKAAGLPVIQVFHVSENGPFAEASGLVRTLSPLTIEPDAIFRKRRHSALIGSGLDVWLIAHGIRRIIISGIRTEQCCETTARHGSNLGYTVDYVSEATLTFPMTDATGRTWSGAEIRARTELVLEHRFARIATVEQALAGHRETAPA